MRSPTSSSISWLVLGSTLLTSVSAQCPAQNAADCAPYWDTNLSVDERLDDLIGRMTIEEKAGQMFQNPQAQGPNGTVSNVTEGVITRQLMTHFNLPGTVSNATAVAEFTNRMQTLARSTRLGIPITVSSDPRHGWTENVGASAAAGALSQWPEALGLAAIRSTDVALEFAQIAQQEYRAIGLRAALHPQVDLATEPRWARIATTFGEDADLTSEMVVAYIRGFQGENFGAESVTTVTKHFPGSGTLRSGNDSHFPTGKDSIYPGDNFEYHLEPFRAAIAAGARQMMPYYSRPANLTRNGQAIESVGGSFNQYLVTDLLREELGFQDGIVLSDWGLVNDFSVAGQNLSAIAWGAENLTPGERMAKILDAGTDQFGGQANPDLLVTLVRNGTVPESRVDTSVRRLLREKFLLGLFDNAFVDPAAASTLVGNADFRAKGSKAQRDSFTLLKNDNQTLPLRDNALVTSRSADQPLRIYTQGIANTTLAALLARYNATAASSPQDADLAILRLTSPDEPTGGAFERNFAGGNLGFNSTVLPPLLEIVNAVPTVVDVRLERPAILTELSEGAAVLLANYGASPEALMDVLFGVNTIDEENVQDYAGPVGRLPFDLPRDMQTVEAQLEDVPFDLENALYRFGDGLQGYASGSAVGTGNGGSEDPTQFTGAASRMVGRSLLAGVVAAVVAWLL